MLKNSINNIIQKKEDEVLNCAIATIKSIDTKSYCADIEFTSKGLTNVVSEKVPLPVLGSGIIPALPSVGDEVVVVFLDRSMMKARIVSYIDTSYKYRTRFHNKHESQGSYLPTINFDDFDDISIENFTSSFNKTWIDSENTDILKYYNFSRTNPIEDLVNDISLLSFFDSNDVGLINPKSKSIVKLKEDGTIDIFSKDNQGIRINPTNKTISFFSNSLKTQSTDWSIDVNNINIKSSNFNVKSDNIIFDCDNLDIQTGDKKLSVEEVIKEL